MGRRGTSPHHDPELSAKLARLRYVNDDEPGISRRRAGRGFTYQRGGERVGDAATLARIRALAVPPAWTDVWICRTADGHIQATGRDARGRKQYRYHARWRAVRDAAKFEHVVGFARALPILRKRVEADLGQSGLPRERVLATVVSILDRAGARVGNESYARDNGSFGLTTLRRRHASVSGATVELVYRGKSGVRRRLSLSDRRLAAVVRRCQELPGQKLFCWVDDVGEVRTIESGDVNAYLRDVTGREVTSKDFRTWAATVAAACTLEAIGTRASKTQRKRCLVRAIERTARLLGNTPAVCRKSYIHPAVTDAYLGDRLCHALASCRKKRRKGLSAEECAVLAFLTEAGPGEALAA